MKPLALGLLIFAILGAFSNAQAAVWTPTRAWTPQEEARYSNWVKRHWTKDFFARQQIANEGFAEKKQRPLGGLFDFLGGGQDNDNDLINNPFFGLRVDCADAVYSMRYVYSFLRRLPFAIQDPSAPNRVISIRATRYDGYPNEADRARQFLVYLFDIVSTDSVANDTFPVALSRQSIRPGSLILTTKKNHHSWTVKDVLDVGVPWLVFNSTVGKDSSVIIQERKSWPNGLWVFEEQDPLDPRAGFRDWRPLEYIGRPVWEVPGYDDEQSRIEPAQWNKIGQRRLSIREEGADEELFRLAQAVCEDLRQRVSAVGEAVSHLRETQYACMDATTFDNFSTPSRDHRLFDAFAELRRAYVKAWKRGRLGEEARIKIGRIFPYPDVSARDEMIKMDTPRVVNQKSICVIEYAQGLKMDMAEAKRRMFLGLLSSNPMDEINYRWGDARGPSPQASQCPSWPLWSPNVDEAN